MARYSTRNGGERDGKGGDEEAEGSRDTGGRCTVLDGPEGEEVFVPYTP